MSEKFVSQPLVAVVTPVYNGGRYLRQAMRSVQDQTYRNIIHIVLDNGSTDDTSRIIDEFSDSNIPVLRYQNKETLPLQQNWNKAFSYLPQDAKYTNLLCSDDSLHRDTIKRFIELAENDPAVEAVISDAVFADEVRQPNLPAMQAAYDGPAVARLIMNSEHGWISFHHFFVRISDDFRGEAFCGSDWSQDPYVTTRSALRGKVGYVPEPLVYSRFHAESVTGKAVSAKSVQPHLVTSALIGHFGDLAFDRRGKLRAVRRYKLSMARQQIVYWLKRSDGAAALGRALAERGQLPSAWHYIISFLTLPLTQWRRRQLRGPLRTMDEATFLNQPTIGVKM